MQPVGSSMPSRPLPDPLRPRRNGEGPIRRTLAAGFRMLEAAKVQTAAKGH